MEKNMIKTDDENLNEPTAKKMKAVSVKYKDMQQMNQNITRVNTLVYEWVRNKIPKLKEKLPKEDKQDLEEDMLKINELLEFACLKKFEHNEKIKESEEDLEEESEEEKIESLVPVAQKGNKRTRETSAGKKSPVKKRR